MDEQDNGILGRVPGGVPAEAAASLPDAATATDDVRAVEIVAGDVGLVRLYFRRSEARHRRSSHWYWRVFRAEPVAQPATAPVRARARERLTDAQLADIRRRHERGSDVWTLLWEIRALRDERAALQAHKHRLEELLIRADYLLSMWGHQSWEALTIKDDLTRTLSEEWAVAAARRGRQGR